MFKRTRRVISNIAQRKKSFPGLATRIKKAKELKQTHITIRGFEFHTNDALLHKIAEYPFGHAEGNAARGSLYNHIQRLKNAKKNK
jgi:hypothetical protein